MSTPCRAGDPLPHFAIVTIDGAHVPYARIWQRRHLLLVCLPDEDIEEGTRYAARLAARQPEIAACDAECLVTREPVPGLQRPAAIVADRWGEIVFVGERPRRAGASASGRSPRLAAVRAEPMSGM